MKSFGPLVQSKGLASGKQFDLAQGPGDNFTTKICLNNLPLASSFTILLYASVLPSLDQTILDNSSLETGVILLNRFSKGWSEMLQMTMLFSVT